MARDLAALGAKNVIVTGVSFEPSKLCVAVYDGNKVEYYFNEKQTVSSHGTGDLYASVVAGALLRGKSLLEAASLGADVVVEAIKLTAGDKDHWYGVKFEQALPYLIKRLS